MVGLQVNAIKPGSMFEEMGLKNGDVITELNGIAIDSPEQSAKILAEFAGATEFSAVVETGEQVRQIEFSMPAEAEE
jgi:general secretion pathway protein C